MNILEIILYPLEKLFELLFSLNYSLTHNYGYSIIFLSLEVSTILIPLYWLAERWKRAEKQALDKMERNLKGIAYRYQGAKKNYLIQKTYQLYNYHPIYSLRASLGLLIQIPFFFAAYLFLSHHKVLLGVSFGLIEDLGKPDSLWSNVNLLPFVMTALNLLSGYIYSYKDKKMQRQLWIMAVVFLVLLYNSPSALVLYWTMNNLYSLVKYIIESKLSWREKGEIYLEIIKSKKLWKSVSLCVLFGVLAVIPMVYRAGKRDWAELFTVINSVILPIYTIVFLIVSLKRRKKRDVVALISFIGFTIVAVLGIAYFYGLNHIRENMHNGKMTLLEVPLFVVLLIYFHKDNIKGLRLAKKSLSYPLLSWLYIFSLVFLTLPLSLYWNNKAEFNLLLLSDFLGNHLSYFLVGFVGLSLITVGLKKWDRGIIVLISQVLLLEILINTFLRKVDAGYYHAGQFFHPENLKQSVGLFFLEALILFIVIKVVLRLLKSPKSYYLLFLVGINVINLTQIGYLLVKGNSIKREKGEEKRIISNKDYLPENVENVLKLSRNHKNIVIFFSDMMSGGVAYQVMEDHPELKRELSGFVNYVNTLSTGPYTIASVGAMAGGHGYTIGEMNKKMNKEDKKILSLIQNAYRDMGNKFNNEGFSVGFSNPQYSSLSYSQRENYTATSGSFFDYYNREKKEEIQKELVNVKNTYLNLNKDEPLFNTSNIMKINSLDTLILLPLFNIMPVSFKYWFYDGSYWQGFFRSMEIIPFLGSLKNWVAFKGIIDLTSVEDTDKPQFKYYQTLLTHRPFIIDRELNLNLKTKYFGREEDGCYYTTLKAIKMFIEWLDILKREGIYDNTKIILVSDHGPPYADDPFRPKDFPLDREIFNEHHATLWVKDFNREDPYSVDKETFLSNADTPAIAYSGVENGKNYSPIDKDPIRNRVPHRILDAYYINLKHDLQVEKKIRVVFHLQVKDSISESKNWTVK